MESAPLTKAHDHARAAAIATQTSDTTVAVTEHAQAAGEFANAARGTSSVEALRTLRLLEQHHKRLSELLRLPSEPTSQNSVESEIAEEDEKDEASRGITATLTSKALPTLAHQRLPGRNLTSSIASNLASARGIRSKYPSQPLAPSVSNDQAPGNLEVHPRRDGATRSGKAADSSQKPSWVPPTIKQDATPATPAPTSPKPASEEGFSRFYNTFGSLINRLSAPLAFAGLPLIVEESSSSQQLASPPPAPAPAPAPEHRTPSSRHGGPGHRPTSSLAEPDLKKIFSRATIRSLPPGADSFYFVPTSGHTASYASILNHENKEKRRIMAASSMLHGQGQGYGGRGSLLEEDEEDDFVDAQEIIQAQHQVSSASHHLGSSIPAGIRNKSAGRNNAESNLRNTVEELHLENSSLKEALDKVSKRLHAFEMNSQSSHLALAQSMRLQRPGSPINLSSSTAGIPAGKATESDDFLKRRNRELEEQVAELTKRLGNMESDYDKLQQTVEKYRERWEKLKAGAKARREAQGQSRGEE